MISAKVILDSVNTVGDRITTLELTYPRFIHSELMTHRVFSRNAASSRAIPLKKQRSAIRKEPAEPFIWTSNQKGMQGGAPLDGLSLTGAIIVWSFHRHMSLTCNWLLEKLGLHKQYANRLTEAHAHITTLVTSTDWANFFALRLHKDAQPDFMELAMCIKVAMDDSTPNIMTPGDWHLPYVTADDEDHATVWCGNTHISVALRMISVARCARVSYTTFDHKYKSPAQDYELGCKLVSSQPLHASPMEHQAEPDPDGEFKHCWGNFRGWVQQRKHYAHERVRDRPYVQYRTPPQEA